MPDPCQPIENRIADLRSTKQSLQEELRAAPPSQKPAFIQLIRQTDVSIREAGAELRRCRSQNPAPVRSDIGFELFRCLDAARRRLLEEALTDAFAADDGIAHADCIDDSERVGIWVPAVGSESGRRAGLEFVNLLREPGETFGQSIGLALIRRNARAAWEAQPKAFNDDGDPSPDGPIFLTSFSFRLESPDRVVTTTGGFRRSGSILPDVDFTATTTDTLGIEQGEIHCDTTTDVDADFSVLGFLLELFLGGPLGAVRALFRIGADIWDSSLGPDDQQGGVGCSALALFPRQIALDDGTSIVTSYSRVGVFPTFILAGGTLSQDA